MTYSLRYTVDCVKAITGSVEEAMNPLVAPFFLPVGGVIICEDAVADPAGAVRNALPVLRSCESFAMIIDPS